MKFANLRVPGERNRCAPCTCRTRSHFFFLDDGSAYNVDTGGTIWFQSGFNWTPVYKCRNYIPWSNGVSRLDHVMRDEQGFPGGGMMRSSRRVPVGKPHSGRFIGFQTDVGSCVVFYRGRIVYEGAYRSDSNAVLGLSDVDYDVALGVGFSEYRNWLTEGCESDEECNVCNNNDPPENSEVYYLG